MANNLVNIELLFLFSCFVFRSTRSTTNYVVQPLEKVFNEIPTCNGDSTWDPCVKKCVGTGANTTSNDANKFRDCAGRCKLDVDYTTEFIIRTDCNSSVCAPRNLDMTACDGQCYFQMQTDQRPNIVCSNPQIYKQGYCLKPSELVPTTIVDDCGVCYGNGSSCRDCQNVKNGYSKLDVCGVCNGRGDNCGLRAGSVDGSDVIIRNKTNITVNTNALLLRAKEVSCIFKAATGYMETKPSIFSDSNNNKVTCQLPDQDGDYVGVQIKIRNEFGQENTSNFYTQNYKIVSYSTLAPSYIEQSEITIGNDIEYASVLMGYLFSVLNKNVAVQCIVVGFGMNQSNITVNATRDPIEPRRIKCPLEITPDHPGRNLSIIVTTNVTGDLGSPLSLKLRGKAPNQVSSTLSEDGSAVIFTFDHPIDATNITCQNLLSDDICKFGANPTCEFINANQLSITVDFEPCVGQTDSNIVKLGDFVRLRSNGLGKFGELPAYRYNLTQLTVANDWDLKNSLTDSAKWDLTPKGIIVAPQKVKSCGTLTAFVAALRAHRGIQFQWSMKKNNVTVQDYETAQYLIENVKNKIYLSLYLEKFSNGDEIELVVHLTNFLSYQNDISHIFRIVNTDIPILEIKPSKNPINFDVSDDLTLRPYFTVPSCASDSVKSMSVEYQWSVNSGTDGSRVNVQDLYIASNTLPANANVTVILEGWFSGQSSNRGEAKLIIKTKPAVLKGSMEGGFAVLLSQTNGFTFTLNATQLKDSFKSQWPVQYDWQCEMLNESSNERLPCFADRQATTIFPNAQQKKLEQLQIEASKMFNGTYRMRLRVYDTHRTISEKDFNVYITNSTVPLVSFMRSRENGYVASDSSLSLEAVITYAKGRTIDFASTKFFALPFDTTLINCAYPNASLFLQKPMSSNQLQYLPIINLLTNPVLVGYVNNLKLFPYPQNFPLAFLDLSLSDNIESAPSQSTIDDGSYNNKMIVRQVISKGRLYPNKKYKFVACAKYSGFNEYGYSILEIKTRGTVKKVEINVSTECTALDNFRIFVKSIWGNLEDTNDQPSYQFGLIDENNEFRIISDSSSSPSAIVLCYPTVNYRSVIYAVEICIQKSCQLFRSKNLTSVNLMQTVTLDDLRRRIYTAQSDAMRTGKFLNAMTFVNAVLQYAQNVRLNSIDYNTLLSNAADVQLQLANEAIKNLDGINVDNLKYFLSASKQIDFTKLNYNDTVKGQIISMVNNFVSKLKNYTQQMTTSSSISLSLIQSANLFISKANFSGSSLLEAKRQVGRLLRQTVRIGNGTLDNYDSGVYQRIQKDMIGNKVAKVKLMDSPEIKFSSVLAYDYDKTGGVGIQTQLYDNVNMFAMNSTLGSSSVASKILDLQLFDINTGDDLVLSNSNRLVAEIMMPNITRQTSKYPTCHYYNEISSSWSTDGVQTQDYGGNSVTCYVYHLTAFTVINSDRPPPAVNPTQYPDNNNSGNKGGNNNVSSKLTASVYSTLLSLVGLCVFISTSLRGL